MNGEWVDLRRRKFICGILFVLVDYHRHYFGEGLFIDALVEVGWFEENMVVRVGVNCVYVVLN